ERAYRPPVYPAGLRPRGRPGRSQRLERGALPARGRESVLPGLLMTQFFQYVVVGLANGGVYATLALALVLIHRATGIVNFAQGEMGMFCTFIAWALINHHGLPYWPAFFITLVIAFFGGAATYKLVIQPLSRTGELTVVMATIALLIILNGLAG